MARLRTDYFRHNTCGLYPHAPLRNLAFPGRAAKQVLTLVHARHLDVSRGKALAAFVGVTLASNGCYLILALALAKLVGII